MICLQRIETRRFPELDRSGIAWLLHGWPGSWMMDEEGDLWPDGPYIFRLYETKEDAITAGRQIDQIVVLDDREYDERPLDEVMYRIASLASFASHCV